MQRFRRHLSYANVVATLALVVAMAGSAYAVNELGTRDIRNNSLRSADLKNRKAVTGRDVRRNSLGGAEVLESRLDAGRLIRVAGSDTALCEPAAGLSEVCVETSLGLPRPSQLIATATGGFTSGGDIPASATCELRIDDRPRATVLNPGEKEVANTSPNATDGFASTYAPDSPLAPGNHTVSLTCTQIGAADAVIEDPSIAVIAVAAP